MKNHFDISDSIEIHEVDIAGVACTCTWNHSSTNRGISCACKPPHDKTNTMTVHPVKTQINMDIRPVWSESSLCTQWVAKDPSFLHADSKDSDQTGRMIWVFAGRICHFIGFVKRWLNCNFYTYPLGKLQEKFNNLHVEWKTFKDFQRWLVTRETSQSLDYVVSRVWKHGLQITDKPNFLQQVGQQSVNVFFENMWAVSWQNQQSEYAPSEDSDQPGHPPSLIRAFAVCMKKPWVLSYPLSTQRRLIRLGGCPSWSESSQGAHLFCWFCHEVAHVYISSSKLSQIEV